MQYTREFDIYTFPFWSGARDRMLSATPEQREAVAERLESWFTEGDIPTETEINDIVWFECDDIFDGDEDE